MFPWALWLSKVICVFNDAFESIYLLHHYGGVRRDVRSSLISHKVLLMVVLWCFVSNPHRGPTCSKFVSCITR